jgi:membrane protein DedA with SNARE-associated domain/rhodanese-related sulfurtransferase
MSHTLVLLTGPFGLAFVTLNILAERIGLPIPSLPTLLVAGAVAATDPPWGAACFAVATLASILMDVAWFAAGHAWGLRLMRLLCRISLTPDSCVSESQARFERWGDRAVLLSKFFPGLSTLAPPLAGALRMGWPRFLALSVAGSALWVGSLLALGALAAPTILPALPRLEALGTRALLLLALLLALYVLYKGWERRRFRLMLRMARVEPEELHAMLGRQPPPLILDARSVSALSLEPQQIPGSILTPLEQLAARLPQVDLDREVIVYCSCPNEASAARVARALMQQGFVRVRPLRGGLTAWMAAGFPVSEIPASAAPGSTPSPLIPKAPSSLG